ncbi:DNA-binding domain-containing protein [Thioflexithrix psekupsensis]|uniref:Putative DNA-binding domain-containing protein n=1 Tax=Thioflexithrix psekupsensis TaxID=1570016 RepID=A0A251X9I2_9GAMM|nr:DNA-binding domain-containing protein [Thioflexithrix psekupsensis]OUD14454.1 hypothetical protein TPSD3_09115 [Thioflexithrix psekupsensis]
MNAPSELKQLQENFADLIWNFSVEKADDFSDSALTAESANGLMIYRNSIFGLLSDALSRIYPVVQRLVGERFFYVMAKHYVQHYPSYSGDLHEYGAFFNTFITHYSPAQSLIYLPDVARLEWAWHCAFHAADSDALQIEALAQIPVDQSASLRFHLHPSAHLLASDYPIQRIWQVNQDHYQGDKHVDLAQGGDLLLILRRNFLIELHRLSPAEFTLLSALQNGKTFEQTCEQTLAVNKHFHLSHYLYYFIQNNTITAFSHD